jgi:hypothetical protein
MSGWMYSATTVFGILLIGAALAMSVIYIQQYENNEQTYYGFQIASVGVSSLIVLYIIVTIAFFRPYNNFAYMFATSLLLVAGLALEIVFDQLTLDNEGKIVGVYMLAGVNALLRLFLLIQVRCDEPLTTIGELIKQAEKVASKTGQPVKDVAKQIAGPLATVDPQNAWKKFSEVLGSLKLVDDETVNRDIKNKIKDETRNKVFDLPARGGRR